MIVYLERDTETYELPVELNSEVKQLERGGASAVFDLWSDLWSEMPDQQ